MTIARTAALTVVTVATTAAAQTASPPTIEACFVPASGTIYRIDTRASPAPGAPKQCLTPTHVAFTWNQSGQPGPVGPAGPAGTIAGVAAGGDLGGAFPSPTIARLQGVPVAIPPMGPVAPPALLGLVGGKFTPLTIGPATMPLTSRGVYDFSQAQSGFESGGRFGTGGAPTQGAGVKMFWHPAKAAIRAGEALGGEWDDAKVGKHSAAFGLGTRAPGQSSFAAGEGSAADGPWTTAFGLDVQVIGQWSFGAGGGITVNGLYSAAFGQNTFATASNTFVAGANSRADGLGSIAVGRSVIASGPASVALGETTRAGNAGSVALGDHATANGIGSVALGSNITDGGAGGSFVFGDRSTSGGVLNASNQFAVRATGGVRLRTSANLSTGCDLLAGTGFFACTSDRRTKAGFEAIDGERLLGRLVAMPVTTWRFRAEPTAVRHMGPTAQDFRRAFALGTDSVSIGTVDAQGVALAAAQALVRRTVALQHDLQSLRATNDSLRRRLTAIERTLTSVGALTERSRDLHVAARR